MKLRMQTFQVKQQQKVFLKKIQFTVNQKNKKITDENGRRVGKQNNGLDK